MSHPSQVRFCKEAKRKFPGHFRRKFVIDVGSLDINGSNRKLFYKCRYFGIDIVEGKNVDVVGLAHKKLYEVSGRTTFCAIENSYKLIGNVNTIISTEMLEHDQHYEKTIKAMFNVLEPGGLLLITCAGVGRPEHGTTGNHPWCSPGTNDYYQNVTNEMFARILPAHLFDVYCLAQCPTDKRKPHMGNDLQFYGIKR